MLPRSTLQAQYEAALLDMGRLVFAYQITRATFGVAALNRNAYNKELSSAVWLAEAGGWAARRARGVVKESEVGRAHYYARAFTSAVNISTFHPRHYSPSSHILARIPLLTGRGAARHM